MGQAAAHQLGMSQKDGGNYSSPDRRGRGGGNDEDFGRQLWITQAEKLPELEQQLPGYACFGRSKSAAKNSPMERFKSMTYSYQKITKRYMWKVKVVSEMHGESLVALCLDSGALLGSRENS